jgi:hypothetical protein
LLVLCNSYAANLFEKLKLADYGALYASYAYMTTTGNCELGWENFERLLPYVRAFKSLAFEEGEHVSIKQLHAGAERSENTGAIHFKNHHLEVRPGTESSKFADSSIAGK